MRFDLNFSVENCRSWGLKEAVREVVANAEDVRAEGGTMRVEHDPKTSTLTVTSDGQTLTTRALVIGATEKYGDGRTIGQFGDGLKGAIGVALRLGVSLRINAGRELWTPRVIHRDGLRVVGVDTRALPADRWRDRVTVTVGGVTAEDWREWRSMFLFVEPARDVIRTSEGSLIRDGERQGCVFCRGVLIERRSDLRYGYDIPTLTLDRDRRVADSWEVQNGARAIWREACRSAAAGPAREAAHVALYALLADPDQDDVGPLQYGAAAFSAAAPDLAERFRTEHGADAVPVSTSAEAQEAGQNGRRGVVVPTALRAVLVAGGVQTLAAVKDARREEVLRTYTGDGDLGAREVDAWEGALTAFAPAIEARGEVMPVVEIVDFADPARMGLYVPASDRVLLARRLLAPENRARLYGTLAHEVAHRRGGDGDASHRQAIEEILGGVVAHLLGGAA